MKRRPRRERAERLAGIIEVARDVGRKYGITIVVVHQSIGELRDLSRGKDSSVMWLEATA